MVQDGLEGPPEELPAEEGALDDEEDLPIEDLLDTEEDEDLSLAALLRRRMQEVCGIILFTAAVHATQGSLFLCQIDLLPCHQENSTWWFHRSQSAQRSAGGACCP